MLKVLVLAVLFALCNAGGYGGSGGGRTSSGGYGSSSGAGRSSGSKVAVSKAAKSSAGSGGSGLSNGYSGSGQTVRYGGGPISAAVKSRYSVEIKPVSIESEPYQPQVIEVDASVLPLTILFRSASSALKVLQTHQAGVGDTQETSSEDEPHRLVHEVTRPIIQEVREVITPYRRIVQEIRPVQEDIQTIVAKGERRASGAYGGGSLLGLGGGLGGGEDLSVGDLGGGLEGRYQSSSGGLRAGYGGGLSSSGKSSIGSSGSNY